VLYAVAFDPRRLEIRGRARPIIDGVLGDPTTGASCFAVSDSGILAYVPGNPSPSARQLAWVEPGGKTTPIDLPPALYTDLHLSPDGARLAFSVIAEGSRNRDVGVADLARGTSFPLISQGTNWTPIWSPDGRRVFSVSYDGEKNRSSIEVRAADGSGDAARIGIFDGVAFLDDITPDGKTVFMGGRTDNAAPFRLYQLGSAGGGDSRPVELPIPTSGNVCCHAISPDGRWFAYATGNGQKRDVYVQSMQPGGGRVQITQDDGGEPHWSADGREVYVLKNNNELSAVPLGPGPALTPGRPRRLSIDVLPTSLESGQTYTVDPKTGRVVVMRKMSERPATPRVRFMLNAFTDTRRDSR
jgi:Tol biopolymer transport system component